MTFLRLLNNLACYTRIILILGLIVIAGLGSQLGQVNVYAGTTTNKCAEKLAPAKNGQIDCEVSFDNGTGGKFQTTAVYRENPATKKYEFLQLKNCQLAGDKATAEGINCAGFAVDGLNIGDDISRVKEITSGVGGSEQGNFRILNKVAAGINAKNFDGNFCLEEVILDPDHTFYRCGPSKDTLNTEVVQNIKTGKYAIIRSGTPGSETANQRAIERIRENFKNGKVKGKDGQLVDKSKLSGLATTQLGDLTNEQITKINDQITDNQQIIDIGAQSKPTKIIITCEVPKLDKDGNVTSVCKGSDGKYYGKDATGLIVLADKCIGVTYDANRNIKDKCLTDEANKIIAALPQNKTLQPIAGAIQNEKAATAGVTDNKSNTAADLLKSLGAIVGWVLFFLIYFVGWIFSFVLFMISTLFVEILSINPAAPAFIGAAVRPWQVLVGLANLVVLGTFIAIGLGYILNYKPLKRNIREFMLQIAVFALLLNFSLLGTGVVVNLASGIGDVMVYSYAGAVKKTGRPNYPRLIGGFVKAINNISAIRCGKSVEPTKKAEFCDVNVSSVPFETDEKNGISNVTDSLSNIGQFLGDTKSGQASGENFLWSATGQSVLLQYLLFESIFVLVMFYAITQMFQAFGLVIFRLVGLWMLMVTSPIALALYLAPAKSLNKYASEWLDKFWKATFFYPFFILALVLHTKLVSAIAVALNVGQTLSAGTDSAEVSPISMAVIVAAGTLAGVSVVGLALVIKWFKDSFGAIVEAAMKGLGKAFGALKTASYLAGTGLKAGGSVLNAGGRLLGKSAWIKENVSDKLAAFGASGEEIAARGGFLNTLRGKSMQIASKARLGSALGGIGNVFNALPDTVNTGTLLAKNTWEGIKKMNKAGVASRTQGQLGNVESAMRRLGMGELADNIEGLKTLEGQGVADMAAKGAENAKLLQDAQQDASTQILGEKFKNASNARSALEVIMKQVEDRGVGSLSQSQVNRMQQLMKRGVDDTAMSSMLFGSETGRALSQSMFTSLDGETQRKIQEKHLGGLSDADAEQRAANLSEMEIKNLSSDSYQSEAVQRGLRRNANIKQEDLDDRIRSASMGTFANIERSRGLTAKSDKPTFTQTEQAAYDQGRKTNMNPISDATTRAFSASVNQMGDQTRAGIRLNDAAITDIVQRNLTASLNNELGSVIDANGQERGIGNMTAGANLQVEVSNFYANKTLKELEVLGKNVMNNIPQYDNLTDDEKFKVLRESMTVKAISEVNSRQATVETLKKNAMNQSKAGEKGDNAAIVPRFVEAALGDYINKGATVQDLDNSGIRDVLAASEVVRQATNTAKAKRGSLAGIDVRDAQGNAVNLDLSGAKSSDIDEVIEEYEKAVKVRLETGNNTAFSKVVDALKKINPTMQATVDETSLNSTFSEIGKESLDRIASRASTSGSNLDIELAAEQDRQRTRINKAAEEAHAKAAKKVDPKLATDYVDTAPAPSYTSGVESVVQARQVAETQARQLAEQQEQARLANEARIKAAAERQEQARLAREAQAAIANDPFNIANPLPTPRQSPPRPIPRGTPPQNPPGSTPRSNSPRRP